MFIPIAFTAPTCRSLPNEKSKAMKNPIPLPIVTGIVLGALIMGACQLMQVESNFRIFGYPGLAILCFLAAATGGFWLVVSIFVQDQKSRKKPPI